MQNHTDLFEAVETVLRVCCSLWSQDQGQDLIEYTLLLAFVAFASAALFVLAGGSIAGIVSVSNSQLAAANTSAS
jgi:Flp pilus assembly pilin Flp